MILCCRALRGGTRAVFAVSIIVAVDSCARPLQEGATSRRVAVISIDSAQMGPAASTATSDSRRGHTDHEPEAFNDNFGRLGRYGEASVHALELAARANGGRIMWVAGMGARCEDTSECSERGLCAGLVGECAVATPRNCRDAAPCRLEAACTAEAGRCVVGEEDSCEGTDACDNVGQCAKEDGVCTAVSRKVCKELVYCALSGLCTPKNGLCLADTDEDCQQSGNCRVNGLCKARAGACVKP
jgi:hypothetical protein